MCFAAQKCWDSPQPSIQSPWSRISADTEIGHFTFVILFRIGESQVNRVSMKPRSRYGVPAHFVYKSMLALLPSVFHFQP